MFIEDLVRNINHKLADEMLSQTSLLMFMDSVVDDINARLNSTFPTFSEVIKANDGISNPDYQAFPDKYQRSVVIVGTASKYYETDEEGNQSAQSFAQDYQQQLFYMLRDYSFNVPPEYRAKDQGFIALSDEEMKAPGLKVTNLPFDTDWTFR